MFVSGVEDVAIPAGNLRRTLAKVILIPVPNSLSVEANFLIFLN